MEFLSRRYPVLLAISFVLMMAALYMALIYAPTEKSMGDIQRIFYFHVPLAWLGFVSFFIVFISSILYLAKRDEKWDALAYVCARIGVVFITLVLITGPIWARPVWGSWWEWEARLTSSLVLWLTYLVYLLLRSYASEEEAGARFAAILGIVGFINVPIVYLSVNLWRTQHPPHLVDDLDGAMLATLLTCLAAFSLFYVLLLYHSLSTRFLQMKVRRLRQTIEELKEDGEDVYHG